MAWTQVGTVTTTKSSSDGNPAAPALPSGILPDDVMILTGLFGSSGALSDVSTPTNWSACGNTAINTTSSTGMRIAAFSKKYANGDNVPALSVAGSSRSMAKLYVVRGVDISKLLFATVGSASASTSVGIPSSGISPSENTLALSLIGTRNTSGGPSLTAPSGSTILSEDTISTISFDIAYTTVPAGTVSPLTFTASASATKVGIRLHIPDSNPPVTSSGWGMIS